MTAVEANVDGLIGSTHSYVGLAPGNLASEANAGRVSNPRAAALEGLAKMKRVADLGIPQFVLPPQIRPHMPFLRTLGFGGSDTQILGAAWKQTPTAAAAACSASAMWVANAATVTPSMDCGDGRVHLTPANLVSNLHRSLEPSETTAALRRLFCDPVRFAIHEPLPAQSTYADEGAANHVRLCADQGAPGVNLFVWGRDAYDAWQGRFPARQTRQAGEAVARRHGCARAVFPRQARAAIEGGAFHNDVVCVGTRTCLFHHQLAFEDTAAVYEQIRRAADGLFEPVFVEVADADLALAEAIQSYLFNSQLLEVPGEDRLLLLAPAEVRETPRAEAVVESLVASNGPIGRVEYVDVRESMRNGGGPACLRLRVVLTADELAAANPGQRLDDALYGRLTDCLQRRYRDRLTPADLADPSIIEENRAALEEIGEILAL